MLVAFKIFFSNFDKNSKQIPDFFFVDFTRIFHLKLGREPTKYHLLLISLEKSIPFFDHHPHPNRRKFKRGTS